MIIICMPCLLKDFNPNKYMDHPRAISLLVCYFMNSSPFSRPGVIAGKEAGMEVVVVPSLPKQSQLFTSADEVINSLLDFQLDKWGLPAFEDRVSRHFFLSMSMSMSTVY